MNQNSKLFRTFGALGTSKGYKIFKYNFWKWKLVTRTNAEIFSKTLSSSLFPGFLDFFIVQRLKWNLFVIFWVIKLIIQKRVLNSKTFLRSFKLPKKNMLMHFLFKFLFLHLLKLLTKTLNGRGIFLLHVFIFNIFFYSYSETVHEAT